MNCLSENHEQCEEEMCPVIFKIEGGNRYIYRTPIGEPLTRGSAIQTCPDRKTLTAGLKPAHNFFFFLSRPSSALISWSSTQVLVDHCTLCAGGYPNVPFSFFLLGGCGGV